ncbi:hypothetical protein PVK06_038502 [Gossypium arboreum]|uniref:Uncharacterized protein n=1 Tax=Gossypium arboreum TaxID=29729 RepID=A0ABR0N0A4_GOSAR|nr:hypothetical protein PVK06_038502 [Gossypium arboreum]
MLSWRPHQVQFKDVITVSFWTVKVPLQVYSIQINGVETPFSGDNVSLNSQSDDDDAYRPSVPTIINIHKD